MDDEWSIDRLSAAYHEAGHAVIAHILGWRVREIRLKLDRDNRWGGETPLARKDDPPGLAKIGYAGPLAEVRYQASKQFPGCTLHSNTTDSVLSYIETDYEHDTIDGEHAELVVHRTNVHAFVFDLNAFSFDAEVVGDHITDVHTRRNAFLAVRQMINRDPIWNAICNVATTLVAALADEEDAVMSRGEFVSTLGEIT